MEKSKKRGLCRGVTLATAFGLCGVLFGLSTQAPAQQAQPAATYPQFSLNTGGLPGGFTRPAAVRLSNGSFVVLVSVAASPATESGTYFQIYRPQGLPARPFTGAVPR